MKAVDDKLDYIDESDKKKGYNLKDGKNIYKTGPVNEVTAKEIGLARYQRIENFDWQAGYTYWDETSDFCEKVREVWSEKIEKLKKIKVNSDIGGNILFLRLFGLADDYKNGNLDAIEKIETTIDEHIEKRESGYGYSITVE